MACQCDPTTEIKGFALGEKLKSAQKNGKRKYTKTTTGSGKPAVVTVDAQDEAHLHQICVLAPMTGQNADSDDENTETAGNLEPSGKPLQAFVKLTTLATETDVKPMVSAILKEKLRG